MDDTKSLKLFKDQTTTETEGKDHDSIDGRYKETTIKISVKTPSSIFVDHVSDETSSSSK